MQNQGLNALPRVALFLLLITLIIAMIPTDAEAAIYDDTVRLHIRARSDSDGDQAVKLEIRDRLLEKYGDTLACGSTEEAVELLRLKTEEIRAAVDGWLYELGCDYTAEVYLGTEWFDRRDYGEFCLPAGEYASLIIELGGGEGANWWCVMYPPMCLDVALSERVSYTEEEKWLISGGKYRARFKLLELAAELMR